MREKLNLFVLMWRVNVYLALILTLCTIYSLPCVLWANELVSRGLGTACVAFWTELASFRP